MARAVTHCPNCGSSVSQFAAGCAICGENLVAARARKERRHQASPLHRISAPSWLPEMTRNEALLGGILILVAFFVPVAGIFIAAVYAFFAHQGGEVVQRNLALIAIGVGLVVLVLISFVPGSWELLPWVDLSGPFPTN